MPLRNTFKNRLKEYEPLAPHTTFLVGGVARHWYEPRHRAALCRFLRERGAELSYFVIGGGSNLLIRDGLRRKVFIRLSAPAFRQIKNRNRRVTVGSGVRIGRLISFLNRRNLSGHEFLAGIPGTIGGAIAVNAGARMDVNQRSSSRSIGDLILEVEVVDRSGRIQRLGKKDVQFSYRDSSLKGRIILSAVLMLSSSRKGEAEARVCSLLKDRFARQDWEHPSAGCFFKNPKPGLAASKLIEACRLKGYRVGRAQVSTRHANFIINTGGAKSVHVLKLMAAIQEKVYNRFKIRLEPEVEIVS